MKKIWISLFLTVAIIHQAQAAPQKLSQTGYFSDLSLLTPSKGFIEYSVAMPLWSDGAKKRRWIRVPAGASIQAVSNTHWGYPVGTVFLKFFEMEVRPGVYKRLELRIFQRVSEQESSRGWLSFSYKWNESGTDADLVEHSLAEDLEMIDASGKAEKVRWIYPDQQACMMCHGHSEWQGNDIRRKARPLGFNTFQLNSARFEESELKKVLQAIPVDGLGTPQALPYFEEKNRARAYLASNCAHCHSPEGNASHIRIDFRYETELSKMRIVNYPATHGSLGANSAARVSPGIPEKSVVYLRMKDTGFYRMPIVGSTRVDQEGVQWVAEWIRGL